MLTIEPPIYVTKAPPAGLTVFRDHVDPDQFYVLPGRPRLALVDGKPRFQLFKYRRDLTDNPALDATQAKGAGVAELEVEVPLDQLAAITADIAAQTGNENARVTPVQMTRMDVRAVIAHPDGDKLIQDLVESHAAPVVAPYHAAFALALSAEGATLLERAAESGELPIGVAYQGSFWALTPSLHAVVTMSYGRIYDHFAASVGFTYYVKVGLDFDLQKLIEDGAVKIDMTRLSPGADGEREQQFVMSIVRARIQRDFFQSSIPPTPDDDHGGEIAQMLLSALGSASGGGISSASALFVLKARADIVHEDKDFRLELDGRTTLEMSHTMSGSLQTLAGGGPAPLELHEIDLDDPFFSTLRVDVTSAVDFAALDDLVEVDVHLARGDFRKAFSVTRDQPGPFVFEVPLTDPSDDQYQLRIDYHFDGAKGIGPSLMSLGPLTTNRRVVVIDPWACFQYRRLQLLLGPLDATLVPRVFARVRVPSDVGDDRARLDFTLDAATPTAIFRMHAPPRDPPLDVVIDTAWEDAHGNRRDGDHGLPCAAPAFEVLGPYRDILSILVQPVADWTKVSQVLVELRYHDEDHVIARQLAFTPANKLTAQRVDFPLRNDAQRSYEWSQTILRLDATQTQTPWATSDHAILVVGGDTPTTRALKLVWLGASPGALAMRVDVWAGPDHDQQFSELLQPNAQKTVQLPRDPDGNLSYHWEARRIEATGDTTLVRSGDGSSDLLVVQG